MFQYPHGNFPSSGGLFSRGKLRLAHFLLQCGPLEVFLLAVKAHPGALKTQPGALEARSGAVEAHPGALHAHLEP